MKHYPLARPWIGTQEIQAVTSVLKSGVLSIGPAVEAFERAFAHKIGRKYACAVSSGTAGLHLALIAAGIGSGDEVITSPFSFVASANTVLYTSAKPVFVDIDPVSYNLDPRKIERAITRRTKAILPVHIFGQSADMDPIMRTAKKYKLMTIEDACESLGAAYHGKQVGTFGVSAVFAFYPNKQMTTGEGGMIVTDDQAVWKQCKSLRNQGRASMAWLDHDRLGYNYRMDEMSAALGLAQIKKLDWLIAKRQKLAEWYSQELRPYRDVITVPQMAAGNTHTWFVYVVRLVRAKPTRLYIMDKLKEKGIQTREYLPSIHLTSFYRARFGYTRGAYPVSESVSASTLALPFSIGMKQKDVHYIVRTLAQIIKSTL